MKQSKETLGFETLQVHAGQNPDSATNAIAPPIYQTSAFQFDSCQHAEDLFDLSAAGNIYSRIMNPTTAVFEQRMAALEGGVGALATASGMTATTYAIQNILNAGDHVVAQQTIYGGTYNLFAHTLPKQGIATTFVNADDPENFEAAMQENTKVIFVETMCNPNSDLVDIETVAKIAHKHQIPLIVDNTFTPPCLLRPFAYGADIVVHSATKFLGGHGTSMGGVIVDSGQFDWKASGKFPQLVDPDPSYHGISYTEAFGDAAYITKAQVCLMRDLGGAMSPFNAFLFLQGLETLSLRVRQHVENTKKVVAYLAQSPYVERVNHPMMAGSPYHTLYQKYYPNGAGSVFTIELKGGKEEAIRFIDNLQLFLLVANVADAKSLVVHPGTTTHSQMAEEELLECGIKPNTIRFSIGIETAEDLIADLEQAFQKI